MARQLLSLPLTKDDIVVAALTTYVRFEFGVNKKHKMPPANLPGDINEVDGDMITKRFFPQLTERTTCEATKTFNTLAFDTFCNELWFGQMHHVMCSAIAYRLQAVGCRGILFNAWSDHNPIVDVPYFLLPGTTMHKAIELPELAGTPIQYWSKQQHQSIADILYRHLNGEQIESPINNYNASTDLDNFY
jgi:hypothetical protein